VGQLAYALAHEQALTLGDLLCRRTRLIWQPGLTPEAAHAMAEALGPLFGGSSRQAHAEADRLGERPAWRR
jgi:glycerol-3-phosphate dehydrogenase